jgi:hypothetical protein
MSTEGLSRSSPSVNLGTRINELGSFTSQGGLTIKPLQRTMVASLTTPSGNSALPLVGLEPTPFLPLIWWRTRRPRLLLCQGIRAIRQALLGSEIPGALDWSRAILGEPAVAIGIAVKQMKERTITAKEVDLALSAVLACALEGDLTSPIVISSALRRRSKSDPSCKLLSELWLVTKF